MIHPHPQMRYQRALDVPDGLLGRILGSRQNMYLVDRARVPRYDPRRNDPGKRRDEILGPLQGEYAAGNR